MKFNTTYLLTAFVPVALISMIVVGSFSAIRADRQTRQDPERLAYEALIRDTDRLQALTLPQEAAHALSPLSRGGVMHFRGDDIAAKEFAIVCLNARESMRVIEGVPVFVRLEKGQVTAIRNDVVTNIMARQNPCRSLGPKF